MNLNNNYRLELALINNNPVELIGLKHVLSNEYPLEIVWEGSNPEESLSVQKYKHLDLIVIDLPPQTDHKPALMKHIKQLRKTSKSVRIAITGSNPDFTYGNMIMMSEVVAFIDKACSINVFIRGISAVLNGKRYISPTLLDDVINFTADSRLSDARLPHECLSNRELQVMYYLTKCSTQSEIARKLDLSVKTVSTYKMRICEKLHVNNTAQIITYAIRNNLIPAMIHKEKKKAA